MMKEIDLLIEEKNSILKKLKSKFNFYGFLRLLLFFGAAACLFTFFISENRSIYYIFGGVLCIILFILLGFVLYGIKEKMNFNKNYIQISGAIKTGNREDKSVETLQIIENHPYADDLDILGKNSLFSYLDHTQSILGKEQLQTFLLNLNTDPKEIYQRQEAIKELSKKMRWSILLLTSAKSLDINKKLVSVEKTGNPFSISAGMKTMTTVFPILSLVFFALTALDVLSMGQFLAGLGFFILSSFLILYLNSKRIEAVISSFELSANQYQNFLSVFSLIEKEEFSAEFNKKLRSKLVKNENSTSIKEIKKLARLLRNFENGKTPLFGILLNVFSLWNLYYALQIEKQMDKIKNDVPLWFETFSQFEALICFGIFTFKNPQNSFPTCNDENEKLIAKNIYHPMYLPEKVVSNDFSISNTNVISIITGANMTGKSTFLRTIGVNLVLAMNGCPVSAEKFSFFPMKLFTSMRTSDSLSNGTSYFNAEILRLRSLIENLENEIPQFIILDEILKGTNSQDKLTGSKLFLEKLMSFDVPFSCIIATHDLELTKTEEEYPAKIKNYCFELKYIDEELEADYKLNRGVTKTMNAIRLMRKFKIID